MIFPKCLTCHKQLKKLAAKHCKSHRLISKKTRLLYRKRMLGNTYAKGKNIGNTHGFTKGMTPWNKGMVGYKAGKNHYAWKGNNASYRSLHRWIERKLGKPSQCHSCPKTNLYGRKIHWANKSKKYLRKTSDWIRLCASCHKKYDSHRQSRGATKITKE